MNMILDQILLLPTLTPIIKFLQNLNILVENNLNSFYKSQFLL